MLKCEKCGKDIPEILNYCPTCKINENEIELAIESDEQVEETKQEVKKSKPSLLSIIILIILSIIWIPFFPLAMGSILAFLMASTASISAIGELFRYAGLLTPIITIFCLIHFIPNLVKRDFKRAIIYQLLPILWMFICGIAMFLF